MASSLAKHRYLTLVATAGAMDSLSGVNEFLRSKALAELGEVGYGKLAPVVRFFDAATKTCVLRVDRDSARHVPRLLRNTARVVATSGSLRACRTRALAVLRERSAAGPRCDDRALERQEAALLRLSSHGS